MNKQINVRLPMKLREQATAYAKKNGYGSVQELITDAVRTKIQRPEFTSTELAFIEKVAERMLKGEGVITEDEFKKKHKMSF